MTTDSLGTSTQEIADGIYRVSTFVPSINRSVNQFLVLADEPLLFHLGMRRQFPDVREAVASVLSPDDLRWLSFGHVEADECGALSPWLAAAPGATVAFGALGCVFSVDDIADRAPRPLADGEVLDLGGRRIHVLQTPHAPHNVEAQVLFEETTRTLLCGDLCTNAGRGPALVDSAGWLADAALGAEEALPVSAPGPAVPDALRRLATFRPTTVAIMHGASFAGDCHAELTSLADAWNDQGHAPVEHRPPATDINRTKPPAETQGIPTGGSPL